MIAQKDYGYSLDLYPQTDEELLKKGRRRLIVGLLLIILSLFFFVYGGFVLLVIGLIVALGDRKYKKIVAQRNYFHMIESKLNAIPKVTVLPTPNAPRPKRRSLAEMTYFDFSPIRKNTVVSRIFPLVVVDVETTGLNRGSDKIISVAAIKYENNFSPSSVFVTLINPERPNSPEALAINKITDEMVTDAPKFYEILEQFQSFIDGCNIAGYNTQFDLSFLYKAGITFSDNVKYYDICEESRRIIKKKEIENYKLLTVCNYLNIDLIPHNNLSDCYATGEVFEALINRKKNNE